MNITPEQALQILDAGTAPQNAGKLSRTDYANMQGALIVLDGVVKELAALKAAMPRPEPPKE